MIIYRQLEFLPGRTQATLPLPGGSGLQAGITLAAAGDMSRLKLSQLPDRHNFLAKQQIDPGRFFTLCQEHTRQVIIPDPNLSPAHYLTTKADGLVSACQPLFLAVTVADCLPLFLYCRKNGAFGIVHSGWKGTGIILEAVRLLHTELGCGKEHLEIVIGPGIGSCCYDVPQERYLQFICRFGSTAGVKRGDRYYLDLRQANLNLLQDAGINNVLVVDNCTACTPQLHSYRRQGAAAFRLMLAYIGYGGTTGVSS